MLKANKKLIIKKFTLCFSMYFEINCFTSFYFSYD